MSAVTREAMRKNGMDQYLQIQVTFCEMLHVRVRVHGTNYEYRGKLWIVRGTKILLPNVVR